MVTTASPIAIPILVEAPSTTAESPARANFGPTGNLLFNTVAAAVPAIGPTIAVSFSTPSSSPLLAKSTPFST